MICWRKHFSLKNKINIEKTNKHHKNCEVWGHASYTSCVCFAVNLHWVDSHFDVWYFQFNALYTFIKEEREKEHALTKYKADFSVVLDATWIIFAQSVCVCWCLMYSFFASLFLVYWCKYAYTRTLHVLCDTQFFISPLLYIVYLTFLHLLFSRFALSLSY